MTVYSKHFSTRVTPQSEPIPGKPMVQNSAGGYSFAVDDWKRLDRFLILGASQGSFYASEKKLTIENAKVVQKLLDEDGARVVKRIVEISDGGKAPKNDPAIFALAMAAGHKKAATFGVAEALPKICRIGTHIFQFCEAVQNFRGWGRSLRSMVAGWYTSQAPDKLAYGVVKYQNRNGWSHRDLLRLCHAQANEPMNSIFHWAVKGWERIGEEEHPEDALKIIWAFEKAKRSKDKKEICKLIREYNLPRECIPTQFLTEASVWEALLEKMPLTALVRNLATMTRVGLLDPLSDGTAKVVSSLSNKEWIRKARVHPMALLLALKTYAQGRGEKGQNTWSPVAQVVDALDGAFYLAFDSVEPTNKRWLLALDVSGSMEGSHIAGTFLSARVASGAMALVTAAVEPQHAFVAFTSNGWCRNGGRGQYSSMGYNNGITTLPISPRQRLDDVCRAMAALPMGGTDCALPMLYAMDQKLKVDVFCIYTDSETWAGEIQPVQALDQYRQKMGIPAKLVVVGMTSNGFSLADPSDSGMLDCVGFSTDTPTVISNFAVE
jgi:60 kDa SS-A/Ro ribonucleoprotein